MKIYELLSEAPLSKQEREQRRFDGYREFRKLAMPIYGDKRAPTDEEMQQLTKFVKMAGRNQRLPDRYTTGSMFDELLFKYRREQTKSGKMPEFTGQAATAEDMARQIATQVNGRYQFKHGMRWRRSSGGSYKDPEHFVSFDDNKDAQDDAVEWLASKGKSVHYHDGDQLRTAYKIGKYLVEPTYSQERIGATPDYLLSVRSANALKNTSIRSVQDITDQQAAALRDIANTKTANAMKQLQALMGIMKGQQDLEKVISNSKKIAPQDKAKLDAIIANAKSGDQQ